jgi:hypothetical protein
MQLHTTSRGQTAHVSPTRNMRVSSPFSSVNTIVSDSTSVFSPRMGYGTVRLERDTTTCTATKSVSETLCF